MAAAAAASASARTGSRRLGREPPRSAAAAWASAFSRCFFVRRFEPSAISRTQEGPPKRCPRSPQTLVLARGLSSKNPILSRRENNPAWPRDSPMDGHDEGEREAGAVRGPRVLDIRCSSSPRQTVAAAPAAHDDAPPGGRHDQRHFTGVYWDKRAQWKAQINIEAKLHCSAGMSTSSRPRARTTDGRASSGAASSRREARARTPSTSAASGAPAAPRRRRPRRRRGGRGGRRAAAAATAAVSAPRRSGGSALAV